MRRNELRWKLIELLSYLKSQEKEAESNKKHFSANGMATTQYYQGKELAYNDIRIRLEALLERM